MKWSRHFYILKGMVMYWKTVWKILINIHLSHNPVILLLGVYPREIKTYVHTKTSTWTFIAVLFIIAQIYTQSKWPLAGKWINCGTSTWWNTISTRKRNELLIHTVIWIDLKSTMLSAKKQKANFKRLNSLSYDSIYITF